MSDFTASPAVRTDAQRRLIALGHVLLIDDADNSRLHVALQAFQRERGLPISGELDAETWHRLIEAGWHLGDRLLYLDRPLQRGDDVAVLQESLALLGFNPGKIDGIFGTLTERALAEFQRDCGLEASGVVASSTVLALDRLGSPHADRRPVTETRGVTDVLGPARRVVVVAGDHPVATALRAALVPTLRVISAPGGDDHAAAQLANAERAGVHLAVTSGSHTLALSYFSSYRSHSAEGRELAESVATRARGDLTDVVVTGMSTPALRETAMPALVIEVGSLASHLQVKVARYIATSVTSLIDRTR